MAVDYIKIRGARQHNLKNVDVDIPRNKLVVITGISGSGKSSLAFDTIYAEGQRRYVESLSAYARQFLDRMDKPDVDSIEGLSPAISIEQKTVSKNPRSTVATVTEIHDYLRLLYARIGIPFCYSCGKKISSQTVQQIVDSICALDEGARIHVLAPIVRGKKGEFQKEFSQYLKEGYVRIKVDGETLDLSPGLKLSKNKKHDIDVFIDRLIIKEGIKNRVTDSVETTLKLSDGLVKIDIIDAKNELLKSILFSEKFSCNDCNISYPSITPQMFSFNSPQGACPECDGLGTKIYFDEKLIVPDQNLTLAQGAIAPFGNTTSKYYYQMLLAVASHYSFSLGIPFRQLDDEIKDILIYGSKGENIKFSFVGDDMSHSFERPFEGAIPYLERRYKQTESEKIRDDLDKYMSQRICEKCNGKRLRQESLHILVGEISIDKFLKMSIKEGIEFLINIKLTKKEEHIARRILKELKERLGFLSSVGLNYLSLDRSSATLSGGEGQRIRLATQIGSSLSGVLYILDEPSIGLHHRDNGRLIETLKGLRDLENTVLVVEHDADMMLNADYIFDMGPGAGRHGGKLTAQGTPKEIMQDPNSLTGKYLSGEKQIRTAKKRRKGHGKSITINKAFGNNLKNLDVSFPLGKFICVTGVSGSGKSTLVNDTLYKYLAQHFYRAKMHETVKCKHIKGISYIDKVINVDQSPIGRTPRSNPATYTGLFTPIRELFADLPDSKMRGYKPGRYSFNVKGGRCEACQGDGVIKIEMHFLPDVFVQCEVCKGSRYNRETLEIKYKGKNISDLLNMTVDEAAKFFENQPVISAKLETLQEVGLGYICLGQFATTLSGGEAQRIKLSKELSKRSTGRTLYILDEPTTGLHFDDIKKLLAVLNRFADKDNTVIVIEHNPDVIKNADHIIDLGPEGGDEGGQVLAQGTPEEIAACKDSYTGMMLKEVL
ncbi:MAG: excinuclease ABC subunit UvrA [Pseudomonadota bacterium]